MYIRKIYTAFLALFFGCQTTSSNIKRVYLVPSGYIGVVKIVYDHPQGVELQEDLGIISYPIGKDGLLKVNGGQIMGLTNSSNTIFHYVDNSGEKIDLQLDSDHISSPNKIVVRGPYLVNKESYFFIDRKSEIMKYKNPSIIQENNRGG